MGRLRFAIMLVLSLGFAAGVTWATFHWFDALVPIAVPVGVNATVLQNTLIISAIVIAGAMIWRAGVQRWHNAGVRFGWALPLAVVPGLAVAILNGPLFLRPYLPLPEWMQLAAFAVAIAAGLLFAGAGLLWPSRPPRPPSD